MGRVEAIAAVRSNPKDAQAWARLGTLLAEAGEKEKATEFKYEIPLIIKEDGIGELSRK